MKELSENLRTWFNDKWTAQDGSPCGSYKGRGRVKCRPSVRTSSKTPQTWGEMTKGEKRKAVRTKQKAHKKGHQFSSHKTGKTWRGTKYKPRKRKLKEGVNVDKGFLKTFMMDAIKNPRKFYALLLLSGMRGTEASRIIYNLKNPRLTSSSFETKMRMLALLQNIIELITHDRIMYSRLRALANSGELEHFGKDIVGAGSYRKRISQKKINFSEQEGVPQTSISAGNIEGIRPGDQPPVPSKYLKYASSMANNPFLKKMSGIFRRLKNRKPKGGEPPNIVVHSN